MWQDIIGTGPERKILDSVIDMALDMREGDEFHEYSNVPKPLTPDYIKTAVVEAWEEGHLREYTADDMVALCVRLGRLASKHWQALIESYERLVNG